MENLFGCCERIVQTIKTFQIEFTTELAKQKMKIFIFRAADPRGDIFEYINRKISYYALRKVFEQIIASGRRLKLSDFDVQWHLHQLPSVRPPVAGHPDDALPVLFEKLRDNFSNLSRQQKRAVLDDLEEISQVARTRGRPSRMSNKTSTRREPSQFEYVEGLPPRKRKATTCGACHQAEHRRSSAACPVNAQSRSQYLATVEHHPIEDSQLQQPVDFDSGWTVVQNRCRSPTLD
ncbi:unnamed protein product [Albugo candida]|uniref:Uncharacterized protein n=1 Tax=Albugo candida TaxID=65357 RepID=A0A024GEF9_9STRA|nr:unnamed protein product [Albugo candida]|eukprot:CCI45158.1 unnamed protein product [Albugo candida]